MSAPPSPDALADAESLFEEAIAVLGAVVTDARAGRRDLAHRPLTARELRTLDAVEAVRTAAAVHPEPAPPAHAMADAAGALGYGAVKPKTAADAPTEDVD